MKYRNLHNIPFVLLSMNLCIYQAKCFEVGKDQLPGKEPLLGSCKPKKFPDLRARDHLSYHHNLVENMGHLTAIKDRSHISSKIPGEGNGNPLQYSCLKNSMD